MGLLEHDVETVDRPESGEAEETKPTSAQPWYLSLRKRLFHSPRSTLATALAVLFLIVLILYVRYARMIDRRLRDGLFSTATAVYSAPRTIALGDAITVNQVVQRLRRAGYTIESDNPTGWFRETPGAIEIFPGPKSPGHADAVRIQFANGATSRITSVRRSGDLREYRLDPQLIANVTENREKRVLVRFQDIPQSLVEAVVSAEDKRFFRHSGFDPIRIIKAAYVDMRDGRRLQGASTITMQLARSLWLDTGKRWTRKFQEFLLTLHIERKLTKQQIFEYYANEVYLGRRGTFNIHGFGEAARAYFGKELAQITTAEAALLAGLVQRPSYYNPARYPNRARERRDQVLGLMLQNGYLTQAAYRQARSSPVSITKAEIDATAAPYFLALLQDELQTRLRDERNRVRYVTTTLDPDLQAAAEEAVRMGMQYVDRQLRGRRGHAAEGQPQVALIALDPHTGEVKAVVGGRDYAASQLNHALSQRQPGSVFKPFVYAAAIAAALEGGKQTFTPSTTVEDAPTTFRYGRKVYQPGNYHDHYMGTVTLRTALAHSLNNATVKLGEMVGFDKVVAIAKRAGLNPRIQPTPSVALGAYEATPLEMAGAYTVFSNQGVRVTPTTIATASAGDGTLVYRQAPDRRAALDPRAAYVMVEMMEEVLRSGTGAGVRARGFALPAAAKTGTSRDGWFAGFTTELLCVVWVGYDDNRELDLQGSQSALPIWTEFMKRAAQFRPYRSAKAFAAPTGLITVSICGDTGLRAGPACPSVRSERFIAGTEPHAACTRHRRMQVEAPVDDISTFSAPPPPSVPPPSSGPLPPSAPLPPPASLPGR